MNVETRLKSMQLFILAIFRIASQIRGNSNVSIQLIALFKFFELCAQIPLFSWFYSFIFSFVEDVIDCDDEDDLDDFKMDNKKSRRSLVQVN
jgi:hypothetical protein